MINRLSGFFLSQRQLLNSWQLPLAGLLLMGGLAATVSTLQAAAPRKQTQAVTSTAVAPPVEAAAPRKQTQAVTSTAVAPPVEAAVPQQQAQAIDSTSVTPPVETAAPQQQAVEPTLVTPPVEAAAPQQQEQIVSSTTIAPPVKAAAPQKQEQIVDSTAVAKPLAKWNRKAQEAVRQPTITQLPTSEASLPDGTYLYGQSSESQQIGKEYLIFEASQGKVTGAMYLPSSEYSCFHGTLDSKQMNLTVVNPYDQTAFSHTIARAQPAQFAAAAGQIKLENTYDTLTYPHTVQLEGYQPISQISENDKQLLSACQNNSQGQVNY